MKVDLRISKLWFALMLLGMGGFFLTIIFPSPQGFYAFASIAALGGLGVSANVYRVKKADKQLVCPIGSNCNAVITSQYSKFLGIPLEYLGILYFSAVFVAYCSLAIYPGLLTPNLLMPVMALSALAFLFSSYLLFVQAFLLRQWCIWCILASAFSYSIFIASLINLESVVAFLANMEGILQMIQSFGFILGLGGATFSVFMFYKFMRDLNIDEKEISVIKGIWEMVWVGVFLIFLGHFAIYVGYPDMASSQLFIMRIISFFTAIFSGSALMIIFAPFLAYIPFGEKPEKHHPSVLEDLKKPIFALGAINISSWYFAFATYFINEYSFWNLSLSYLGLTALLIMLSLTWEEILSKRSLHK